MVVTINHNLSVSHNTPISVTGRTKRFAALVFLHIITYTGSSLAHRLRRWPSIKVALGWRFLLDGYAWYVWWDIHSRVLHI